MRNEFVKNRGVRYIANALRKYYPARYETGAERSKRAHEIHQEFKKSGQKAVIRNIKAIELEYKIAGKAGGRKKKKVGPSLPSTLREPSHYFNIQNYKEHIYALTVDVYFQSTISDPELPLIKSKSRDANYQSYFSEYVDMMNGQKNESDSDDDYEEEWYVVCTEPEFDKKQGIWISKIISCDASGNPNNYGYIPEKGSSSNAADKKTPPTSKEGSGGDKNKKGQPITPLGKETSPETTPVGQKSEKVLQIEAETAKIKVELDRERQKNINQVFEMMNKGLITKLEAKEFLQIINKDKQ